MKSPNAKRKEALERILKFNPMKGAGEKDYTLPVGFVKGGVQQQTERGDIVERNENSSSSLESVSSVSNDPRKKLGNEISGWEKHTKGIGAKLPLKMGYQPGQGLGKSIQGRSEPIEAKIRKGRSAIGSEELMPPQSHHRSVAKQSLTEQKIRNKKFSKKKSNKNVLAAVPQAEFPRGKNLVSVEYSPRKTLNNPRSSRNDRIPDLICIASSDDEDCLILSDVENSPKTSLTSGDANRTTKRTPSLKSPTSASFVKPSAVPSDVVCISSSDEEDCLFLSDVNSQWKKFRYSISNLYKS